MKGFFRQKGKSVRIALIGLIIVLFAVNFGTSSIMAYSQFRSRGKEVVQIQQKLKELGFYKGKVDGIYGLQTERAVINYQRSRGLKIDGKCGPQTLRSLGITTAAADGGTGRYSNSEVNLLARVISAEARGEPYTGQVAVGAVVLNRVEHPSFPNTIAGVLYQPGAFTCMTDGNFNQPVVDSAYRAARDAMNGWDPSGGAIYYYNPARTTSKWIYSRPKITKIGKHIFCK